MAENRPVRNLVAVTFGYGATRIPPIIGVPLTLHRLGVRSYGQLGLLTAVSSFGILLSSFGIQTLAVRDVARDPGRYREVVADAVWIRLALSLVAVALMMQWAASFEHGISLVAVAGYAALLPLNAVNPSWILNARHRPGWAPVTTFLGQLAYLGVLFAWLRTPGDLAVATWAQALAVAVAAAIDWGLCIRLFGPVPLFPSFRWIRPLRREATVLGLGSLLSMSYDRVDVILIHLWRGAVQTGLYAAAYGIMNFSLSLLTLSTTVMWPLMADRLHHDPTRGYHNLASFTRHIMVAAVPVIAGTWLFAPDLLRLIGGPHYVGGTTALRFLAPNFLAAALAMIYSSFVLLPLGRSRAYTVAVGAGAGINLALNVVLIPTIGIAGASIATVAAQLAVAAVAWRAARPGVSLLRNLSFNRLIAATMIGGATIAVLRSAGTPAPVQVVAGGCLYAAAAAALGLIDLGTILSSLRRLQTGSETR